MTLRQNQKKKYGILSVSMVLTTIYHCSEWIYIHIVILPRCQNQQQKQTGKVNIILVLFFASFVVDIQLKIEIAHFLAVYSFSSSHFSPKQSTLGKQLQSNKIKIHSNITAQEKEKWKRKTLQKCALYHVETTLNACIQFYFILF